MYRCVEARIDVIISVLIKRSHTGASTIEQKVGATMCHLAVTPLSSHCKVRVTSHHDSFENCHQVQCMPQTTHCQLNVSRRSRRTLLTKLLVLVMESHLLQCLQLLLLWLLLTPQVLQKSLRPLQELLKLSGCWREAHLLQALHYKLQGA